MGISCSRTFGSPKCCKMSIYWLAKSFSCSSFSRTCSLSIKSLLQLSWLELSESLALDFGAQELRLLTFLAIVSTTELRRPGPKAPICYLSALFTWLATVNALWFLPPNIRPRPPVNDNTSPCSDFFDGVLFDENLTWSTIDDFGLVSLLRGLLVCLL